MKRGIKLEKKQITSNKLQITSYKKIVNINKLK